MFKIQIKISFFVLLITASLSLFSQNIGINTTGAVPSTNAILDLNTGNTTGAYKYKLGLIIPHVKLGASLSTFGMATGNTPADTGMLVYNLPNTPQLSGYYYWNGNIWVSVSASGSSTAWLITGNSNIVDGTNFLGTKNSVPINFQINGNKAGRVDGINYNTFLGYLSGDATTATTTGRWNSGFGNGALYSNTTGEDNTAIGSNALFNNETLTSGVSAVGYEALYADKTGVYDAAIGYEALYSNTSGENNAAMGAQALYSDTNGYYNTATGCGAMYLNPSGQDNTITGAFASNQAMLSVGGYGGASVHGAFALYSGTGGDNTAIGYGSLYSSATNYDNTAMGWRALYSNKVGEAVAIGDSALYSIGSVVFDGSSGDAMGNAALFSSTGVGNADFGDGYHALFTNTSGGDDIAIGYEALANSDSVSFNTAMGYQALFNQSNGYANENTAVGYRALYKSNSVASSSNSEYNTGIGAYAGYSNTSGKFNTSVGTYSRYSDTSGIDNTAIGYSALYSNTNANSNTANGDSSLFFTTTGDGNTANGFKALASNTNANSNTAIGDSALYANVSGVYNTANGYGALYSNISGDSNTASGYEALALNSAGSKNTAEGYKALYFNTNANQNAAIGAFALYSQTYNNGGTPYNANNVAAGYDALYYNNPTTTTTGIDNTAVGTYALYNNTSGYGNTAIGDSALYYNTNGSYNTAIGYLAGPGVGSTGLTNTIAIGYGATVTASNTIEIGNSSVVFFGLNGATHVPLDGKAFAVGTASGANGDGAYLSTGGSWVNISDRNKKQNFSIPDGQQILNKVAALPIYRWNYKREPVTIQHIGPMAQDFYRIFGVGNDSLSISTIDPAGIALVAIKQLNKNLEQQNHALQQKVDSIQKQDTILQNDDSNLQNTVSALMNSELQKRSEIAEFKKKINSRIQLQASVK